MRNICTSTKFGLKSTVLILRFQWGSPGGGGDFSDLVGERSACKLLLQKFNSEKVFWPGSWWGHFEGSGWGSGEQVDDTKVVKFLWKYRQFEV